MTTSTVRYLSTLSFSEEWLARLRSAVPGIVVEQFPAAGPQDVPAEVWRHVDVLHTSGVFPDPNAAPSLRWVQLDTSGVDHVRGQPVWQSDIAITTIGGVSPVPLAEYVIFAILGFAHRLPAMLETRASRYWPDPVQRWESFLPMSLAGATVVILGYGRIGREIGRLARAHGMEVVGVTRTGGVRSGAEAALLADVGGSSEGAAVEIIGPDGLREALSRADYLVVVVPLTDQTREIVDAAAISALKPGAVVVNVARGGIVNEDALLAALRSGAVRGAMLDVFDQEPLAVDSPWWDEPNAFVTPHVAGLAPHYAEQVLALVTQNLRRFQDGAPLLNLVDRERGY